MMSHNKKEIPSWALGFLGCAFLIFIWFFIGAVGIVDQRLFPDIFVVTHRLLQLIGSGEIFPNIFSTLYRTVIGFIFSALLAIPIGLLIGSSAFLERTLGGVIDFFRSLPGTAMFPLFLLFFGIGDGSKIAIAMFLSFWVILVNAVYGARYASTQRKLAARSLGASPAQIFIDVTLHEALPHIVAGLKTGLSLSLIAVVVSEMFIGSSSGLGQKIYDAYLTYESSSLFAWLIITGFFGFSMSKLASFFDHRLLHWADK